MSSKHKKFLDFSILKFAQFPQRVGGLITLAVTMVRDWGAMLIGFAIALFCSSRPNGAISGMEHTPPTQLIQEAPFPQNSRNSEFLPSLNCLRRSYFSKLREFFFHLLIIPPNVGEDSRSRIFQCKYVQSFNAG